MKRFNEFVNEKTQLQIGTEVESEHEDIYDYLQKYFKDKDVEMPISKEEFFMRIAKDHLKELPDYYTRLVNMEKEAEGKN